MNCGNKKVILTGASGLIGTEVLQSLLDSDLEIFAIDIKEGNIKNNRIHWINCNLFDENSIKKIFEEIKPEYMMHFAWCVTGYFNDNLNFDFLAASINLLKHFNKNGGKRVIMTGTYAEYGENASILKEDMPTNPLNLYSKCKNHLNRIATDYCSANGISFGWARLFSVFGKETDNRRLTADVIEHLKKNEEVVIRSGSLIRDYIYVKDIANAMVKFLLSNVEGSVNICSGQGTSIRDYVMTIAKIMNKENLVVFNEVASNQQTSVIGDNSRLTNGVGYKLQYSVKKAIEEILNG